MNLLNNAIKFTAKGEVVMRVASADPEAPGAVTTGITDMNGKPVSLRFSVSDTGIGIPKERMDRLFKSFSQVDTSITRRYGGTGLGLAISKQLVELMGGVMGVESEAGKGSTFWFTVTFEHHDRQEQPRLSLRGHRVLVVDDNLTQCELLVEQLSAWGVIAASATSAPDAIEILQKAAEQGTAFESAIVDLKMPGMDGLAMAKVVRSCAPLRDLSLILMSGLDASVEAESGGFVGFLTKPIRLSNLYDSLMKSVVDPKIAPAVVAAQIAPVVVPENTPASMEVQILLAEDMEVNQFVVTETIARYGYTCDIANNGREAVTAVSKKQYDIVLMDCQMPEMSGFEAAIAIRALEVERGITDRRVPIIALTANAVKGDRERCLAAGMDEYLTKPLNPAKLIETIRTRAEITDGASAARGRNGNESSRQWRRCPCCRDERR